MKLGSELECGFGPASVGSVVNFFDSVGTGVEVAFVGIIEDDFVVIADPHGLVLGDGGGEIASEKFHEGRVEGVRSFQDAVDLVGAFGVLLICIELICLRQCCKITHRLQRARLPFKGARNGTY